MATSNRNLKVIFDCDKETIKTQARIKAQFGLVTKVILHDSVNKITSLDETVIQNAFVGLNSGHSTGYSSPNCSSAAIAIG